MKRRIEAEASPAGAAGAAVRRRSPQAPVLLWGALGFALLGGPGLAQGREQERLEEADLFRQRLDEPWKLDLTLSFSGHEGNSDASGLGLQIGYRKQLAWGSFRAAGKARNAGANDATVAESYSLDMVLSRRLSDRSNLVFLELFHRDRFKGFGGQNSLGVGYHRVWRTTPSWLFEATFGASWRHEDLVVPGSSVGLADDDYGAALLALQAEETLSKNAHFHQQAVLHLPLDGADNYGVDVDLSLQTSINEALGVTLGLEVRYDNEPVLAASRADVRYHAGLTVGLSGAEHK